LLVTVFAAGCGATTRNPTRGSPGEGSAGTSGAGSAGSSGGADCEPPAPAIVRLAFSEALAGIDAMLGEEVASRLANDLALPRQADAFPPLASVREGEIIHDSVLGSTDQMAQRAGKYVRENFLAVTGCQPDYDCVRSFLGSFAERAYRRPLDARELAALEQVTTRAQELKAPAEQAVEYAVYAIFSSPQFLYRTQLGSTSALEQAGETRLTEHELASTLSFFLTGAPPDEVLLDLAATDSLSFPEELETQAARLLEMPATRKHLQHALSNYFRFDRIATAVLDPAYYPEYDSNLATSMRYELDGLLEDTLWTESLPALLTSRNARVDAGLAALYGIGLPAELPRDELGFVSVVLPESRAGLLTRTGAQVMVARPDGTSVVGRGLFVNELIRCFVNPPFPDLPQEELEMPVGGSEREKAESRAQTEPCSGCHIEIDPFGLALDELDAIGRYRSHDDEGRAIDAAVELPRSAGGQRVQGAVELSIALADEVFTTCLSQRLLQYALVLPAQWDQVSCEAERMSRQRTAPQDSTLASVVAQIVSSEAFLTRKQ
jgi:hypothetical protein